MLTPLLILLVFAAGAALMITRKLPALLALPIMGLAIALGTWMMQRLGLSDAAPIDLRLHILKGVVADGAASLATPMLAAFFGGMLSFVMQKSGVAESLVKNGAELIGDNALAVAFFSMLLVAGIFTTIGGLGAIIMVAIVVLPMLATVGVPPAVAGGILLFGLSMGGIVNAQNWALYIGVLGMPQSEVRLFALAMFLLMAFTGLAFIVVELWRARALRSLKQAAAALAVVGTISTAGIGAIVASRGAASAQLPFFEESFASRWTASGAGTFEHRDGISAFRFRERSAAAEAEVLVLEMDDDMRALDGFAPLRDRKAGEIQDIMFSARGTFDGSVRLVVERDGADPLEFAGTLANGQLAHMTVPAAKFGSGGFAEATRVRLFATVAKLPADSKKPVELQLTNARFNLVPVVPTWLKALRIGLGAAIGALLLCIAVDLVQRVKRWRRQVVTVKWYAMLIPALPLALILVYDMDVNAALAIGFVYAILATIRPGSKSLAVQSMIQGSASVLPAVLLMVGIGILLKSIMGPTGFQGGWPVIESMKPLLAKVLPSNPVAFVVVFGLAAPLALYRGPLNLWGLGFGVAQLFLAAEVVPAAALMAMLISVGQLQGICDPTNTHNVWIANEVRTDVQQLMFRTVPYVWAMAIAGLAIGAAMYF